MSGMFGFAGAMRSASEHADEARGSSSIRSAAQGRVLWSTEHAGFEPVPRELLDKTTAEIRTRKGLKPEPYSADYYAG